MIHASVRYGRLRFVGEFAAPTTDLPRGSSCLVQTPRGTEVGTVLSVTQGFLLNPEGEILRELTPEDQAEWQRICEQDAGEAHSFCLERIARHGLDMRLALTERLFGGEKLIFYFLSEGRVDFRALVRDLARKYKTRIEMKQIGARDEARLLGDIGPCGRTLCCGSHIGCVIPPVTMQMAKNQRTALDPSSITGACGRLKCCLRYENELYQRTPMAN